MYKLLYPQPPVGAGFKQDFHLLRLTLVGSSISSSGLAAAHDHPLAFAWPTNRQPGAIVQRQAAFAETARILSASRRKGGIFHPQ
jgi:hypothetical protein